MTCCLEDETLTRLLEEQLAADEHGTVVAHVESCVACQERLRDLTKQCDAQIGLDQYDSKSTNHRLTGESFLSARSSSHLASLFESRARAEAPDRDLSGAGFPVVAGYDILVVLGHGGMGVVYKARQQRLSRLVALKMIRAGTLAKPEDLARFRVEAEAIAQLRHPNILEIYDIGEINGLPYVALELLEGGSLDDRLAGKPQPARPAAELVATLARAVHAAHQAGIVHRDLKPANVLFTRDGTPKVTDFGLAKRLEEAGHTETGQVLGSPSYIPPEQARGRSKEVRPAADVYALGAILYEMLTGRPPFQGATPVDTVMQVVHDEPVHPSRLHAEIPRDLETICLKCLAKEQERRYVSAQALAADLECYLADRPIQARRTPLWERSLKWARRRPAYTSLMAVGLTGALCLTIAGLNQYAKNQARARWNQARLKNVRPYAETALKKAEDDMMASRFEDAVGDLRAVLGALEGETQLADLRARTAELLGRARGDAALHHARQIAQDRYQDFFRKRDEALFWDTQLIHSDPSESIGVIRQAARAALDVYAASPGQRDEWVMAEVPSFFSTEQKNDVERGCYEMLMVLAEAVAFPLAAESAPQQARAALRVLERAAGLRPQPTHAYHLRRASCLERAGDAAGAEQERRAAACITPEGAFDHFLSALDSYKRGRLAEAKRHFDAALEAEPKHFWSQCLLAVCDLNARPPQAAEAKAYLTACLQTHTDLAWLFQLRGFASGQLGAAASSPDDAKLQFEAAEADYRRAARYDPTGKFRYGLLVNRGIMHFQSGKLAAAVADLKEAIALCPKQHNAFATLAQVYKHQKKLDEALEQIGLAIALKPDSAAPYRTRALWNLERGERDPAVRAAALRDLAEAMRRDATGSRELVGDHTARGHLLLLNKEYGNALVACDAALRINPDDAEANHIRVMALLELKRYREAIAACDRYLRTARPNLDLLELRGLAKAKRNDFAGAIEDYTLALVQNPSASVLHARRGWAYLVSGAPKLALRDFQEAIRIDPSSGDAHSGRGSALAALGLSGEAVSDAEESLRHGEPDPRLLYNAARILAQAAQPITRNATARARADAASLRRYQERALVLLGQALKQTAPEGRAQFWSEVVQTDHAFKPLHRLPDYLRWAAQYSPRAQ
jgi:serine/threonine protein kinase/predicted Zn-dependent protease